MAENKTDFRVEHDFIGNKEIPNTAYYGVQTSRGMENFHISGVTLKNYPTIIKRPCRNQACMRKGKF